MDILSFYSALVSDEIKTFGVTQNMLKQSLITIKAAYNLESLQQGKAFVDYNIASNRCAYLCRYGPFHAELVRKYFCKLISESSEFLSVLESKNVLKICSLGGGGGSDLLGLLMSLASQPRYFKKIRELTILDNCPGWNDSFKRMTTSYFAQQATHPENRLLPYDKISTCFSKADLLVELTDQAAKAIREADIICIVKFVSVVSSMPSAKQAFQRLACIMKPGVIVMYIDNSSAAVYKPISEVFQLLGFQCIYGPFKHCRFSLENFHSAKKRFMGIDPLKFSGVSVIGWKKSSCHSVDIRPSKDNDEHSENSEDSCFNGDEGDMDYIVDLCYFDNDEGTTYAEDFYLDNNDDEGIDYIEDFCFDDDDEDIDYSEDFGYGTNYEDSDCSDFSHDIEDIYYGENCCYGDEDIDYSEFRCDDDVEDIYYSENFSDDDEFIDYCEDFGYDVGYSEGSCDANEFIKDSEDFCDDDEFIDYSEDFCGDGEFIDDSENLCDDDEYIDDSEDFGFEDGYSEDSCDDNEFIKDSEDFCNDDEFIDDSENLCDDDEFIDDSEDFGFEDGYSEDSCDDNEFIKDSEDFCDDDEFIDYSEDFCGDDEFIDDGENLCDDDEFIDDSEDLFYNDNYSEDLCNDDYSEDLCDDDEFIDDSEDFCYDDYYREEFCNDDYYREEFCNDDDYSENFCDDDEFIDYSEDFCYDDDDYSKDFYYDDNYSDDFCYDDNYSEDFCYDDVENISYCEDLYYDDEVIDYNENFCFGDFCYDDDMEDMEFSKHFCYHATGEIINFNENFGLTYVGTNEHTMCKYSFLKFWYDYNILYGLPI